MEAIELNQTLKDAQGSNRLAGVGAWGVEEGSEEFQVKESPSQ